MAHILLIDDDELMRYSLCRVLETDNHQVFTATDGSEGLRILRDKSFDLVITDILMPEKEGLEVIAEIKQDCANLPVIAISGGGKRGDLSYLEVAELMGAAAVFSKPINIKKMLATVADLTKGKNPEG